MNEMVERAARAMKERAAQPLHNIPSLEPVLVGSLGDAWPYLARAAIASMREPTEAMWHAGAMSECAVSEMWRAMCDAALKE